MLKRDVLKRMGDMENDSIFKSICLQSLVKFIVLVKISSMWSCLVWKLLIILFGAV